MKLGDDDGDDVKSDQNYQRIKGNFVHRHKRSAERSHGLVRRLIDQTSVPWLDRAWVNARRSNPLGKPVPKGRPEQIRTRNYKPSGELNRQKQEQQGNPDAGYRIVPDVLLRFTGQERNDIGSQTRQIA